MFAESREADNGVKVFLFFKKRLMTVLRPKSGKLGEKGMHGMTYVKVRGKRKCSPPISPVICNAKGPRTHIYYPSTAVPAHIFFNCQLCY